MFSNKILLSNTAGQNSGGGFACGATGGLFTLHGSGATPVTVTASLKLDGAITKAEQLSSGVHSSRIGTWAMMLMGLGLVWRVSRRRMVVACAKAGLLICGSHVAYQNCAGGH